MFCSECGKPAQDKFCSHCGVPLAATKLIAKIEPTEITPDWDHEVQYESILKYPGVRDTIRAPCLAGAKAFDWRAVLDVGRQVSANGSVARRARIRRAATLCALGIKTGKERVARVVAPIGQVIVRALCSLASHGQKLRSVTQAADGCLFEAALPSDLFSLEGTLLVSIKRNESHAEVCGATHIRRTTLRLGQEQPLSR